MRENQERKPILLMIGMLYAALSLVGCASLLLWQCVVHLRTSPLCGAKFERSNKIGKRDSCVIS